MILTRRHNVHTNQLTTFHNCIDHVMSIDHVMFVAAIKLCSSVCYSQVILDTAMKHKAMSIILALSSSAEYIT